MAQKTITSRQRQKYDTSTNWKNNNPILLSGEIGIESDTKKIKVGDGVNEWNNLDYVSVDLPENIVKTDNNQSITGQKTFVSKELIIKQTSGYKGFRVNNTDITRGQVTESTTGAGRLVFYDKDNNILGYVQQIILKDGTSQLQLSSQNDGDNATLSLNAKPDDSPELYTDDTIRTTRGSTRYLDANNGAVPIVLDRTGGQYNMLANMKSTNGVFCFGTYQNKFMITYTSNETIEAGTNAVDKQWWFNEDGSLIITNNADASGKSYNGPALVIGGTQNQAHIEINSNEILAKANATTPTSLFLNSDGGEVWIGSNSNGFHFVTNLSSNNFFGPAVDKGVSLGNGEYRWLNAYLTNLNVSGGSTSVPTPSSDDNSTAVATTAWVKDYICPAGTVVAFAGSTIPAGWLLCDGSIVNKSDYPDLFNAIETTYGTGETTYGTGNGSTTFNLPNLSGKVAIGVSSNHNLADSGGEENHYHTFYTGMSWYGGAGAGDRNALGYDAQNGTWTYGEGDTTVNSWTNTGLDSGSNLKNNNRLRYKGTTESSSNMPPYLALNYIIKY